MSLNQATIKYASLATALEATACAGIGTIGLWREPVAAEGIARATSMIGDSGLRVSSLCRGGFFTMTEGPQRRGAIDDNKRALEEAAALGAPTLVLVAGGLPVRSRDLAGARERVRDAVGELADFAGSTGVSLAIEALHPMYATDRAVISTLGQALDIATQFDSARVGVVVDTFHVFWDPDVLHQISRAGSYIASYQVCDWATPLPADVLLARHQPGDGVIDFAPLTAAVLAAGYAGAIEVEIFNQAIWDAPAAETAVRTASAFASVIAPLLGG
jgi:sugar phosphate isomerase/epimerase